MNHSPHGMPSELLDHDEIEHRFKDVDQASARARLKIELQLAHGRPITSLAKLVVPAKSR